MRKEILFCLLSGILLSLAFSFSQCWVLAWFGFVPLLLALDKQSARKALLLSYLCGLVFWIGTIYWLVHVTLFGQILLILYLALYFGVFGLVVSITRSPAHPLTRSLFIPSLWVLLEYVRSHLLTGFPWALLGYSQYANLPVIQIADIGGAWLVSFVIMMVNTEIYVIASERSGACLSGRQAISDSRDRTMFCPYRGMLGSLIMIVIVLLLVLSYGYYKLYPAPSAQHPAPFRLSVVQGDIPQHLKWLEGSREFIMERYFNLSAEAAKDNPDLIIWPEASLPVILEEEPIYFERLSRYTETMGRSLLFGAVTKRDGLYYNSALLLSKEGKLEERYDKLHLVPFGEFIPLRRFFLFLETIAPIGDITPGRDYTLFNLRHQFGVLICFEDVFPELSRQFVRGGADFLVNITNDAWFGKTSEAAQHLAASVFRAIENRVNLVRAANTGISCFINPQGKILSLVKDEKGDSIFIPGHLTQELSPQQRPTIYGSCGDFLVILCLGYILGSFVYLSLRTRAQRG